MNEQRNDEERKKMWRKWLSGWEQKKERKRIVNMEQYQRSAVENGFCASNEPAVSRMCVGLAGWGIWRFDLTKYFPSRPQYHMQQRREGKVELEYLQNTRSFHIIFSCYFLFLILISTILFCFVFSSDSSSAYSSLARLLIHTRICMILHCAVAVNENEERAWYVCRLSTLGTIYKLNITFPECVCALCIEVVDGQARCDVRW